MHPSIHPGNWTGNCAILSGITAAVTNQYPKVVHFAELLRMQASSAAHACISTRVFCGLKTCEAAPLQPALLPYCLQVASDSVRAVHAANKYSWSKSAIIRRYIYRPRSGPLDGLLHTRSAGIHSWISTWAGRCPCCAGETRHLAMISLDFSFNVLTRDLSLYLENQVKVGLFGSGVGLSLVLGFSAAYTCYYLVSVAKVTYGFWPAALKRHL